MGVSVDSKTAQGAALVAIASLCFGALGVLARHVREAGLDVPTMLSARFGGGALVLWVWAAVSKDTRAPVTRRVVAAHVVLGVLYVVEAFAYFESALRIPVALTALLLYAYPAIVAVLSWALFKEPLTGRRLLAVGLSLGGVGLSVGTPEGALDVVGVLLGLASAGVYSVYMLVGSRVSGVSPTLGAAWVTSVAALLFGAMATLPSAAQARDAALPLAGLVLVGTVIPIPLLLLGLRRLGSVRGAVVSSIEPVAAAAFGAALLGETLTALQAVGGLLVLASVAVVASPQRTPFSSVKSSG